MEKFPTNDSIIVACFNDNLIYFNIDIDLQNLHIYTWICYIVISEKNIVS